MPKKILEKLAFKACRKAVMVGTTLNCAKMRNLVDHLHDLKNPWICAHGRPTMRFLFNLDHFSSSYHFNT